MNIKFIFLFIMMIFFCTSCKKQNNKQMINIQEKSKESIQVKINSQNETNIEENSKESIQVKINSQNETNIEENSKEQNTDVDINDISLIILEAIIQKDFDKLTRYISEEKGLQLSFDYLFNSQFDLLLTKKDLINHKDYKYNVYIGNYDDYQKLTLEEIFDFFSADIALLQKCIINNFYENDYAFRHFNLSNIKEYFPSTNFVDCFFNPSGNFGEMDWKSILLVLEIQEDNYILVGLAIDQIDN